MRKIFAGAITAAFFVIALFVLPYIVEFAAWLITIDNADFGFPKWLDIIIDIIAGGLATIFAGFLFSRKRSISTAETVISIVIGFIIGTFVHCILRYWYIWVSIIVLIISGIIIFQVVKNKKNKSLEDTDKGDNL